MKKITICGGGSLGHVCIGFLSSQENLSVDLLTSHPEKWNREILVKDANGKVFEGHLGRISSNPQEVIPDADVVILCLPGFLIKQTLEQIKPYISEKAVVGSIVSSTGFFFFAHEVLGEKSKLFGFQRVPFIARVVEYGRNANLLGYKSSLNIAVENVEDKESFRSFVEASFNTPVNLLQSFYEACLTNSNPILHTGRLYSMWHNWDGEPYDHCILFYKEWTEDAAQWLIDMDAEFMRLLEKLPMNQKAVPPLLEYYESTDAKSLAAKLSSIKAFETIKAPMIEAENGWIPDFESRYFTEDFPFGLRFIVDLAKKHGVETPKIDVVYEWGMSKCQKNFSKNRYKELLIKTLSEFIKVCDQNGIEYIGAYGTVLGAIRHKGLIPWDDDIDVFMTRENYEKFLRLKGSMAGTGYEIVDLDDKGYYLPFAKFCDAQTTIWEVENLPFVLGVFIDVFPLDYVEENDEECVKLRNRYFSSFERYIHSLRKFCLKDLLSLKGLKSFLKSVYFGLIVNRKLLRNLEEQIKSKRGPYRMYYRSRDSYSRSKFDAAWFDECIEVPYESMRIRVPKNYDAFLKQCYGDYMTPPPEEKRVSQHFHYFVDLDQRLSIEEIKKIKNGN